MTIPVVLFLHSRPDCAATIVRDICCSSVARDIELYIFVDGPRSDAEASLVANTISSAEQALKENTALTRIHWHISKSNKGLARSVIYGVSSVLEEHESTIVLEDDLLLSPFTIEYLTSALKFYSKIEDVFSVTGYNYPTKVISSDARPEFGDIFLPRPSSWAWGTWKRVWDEIEWDGPIYDDYLSDKELQLNFGNLMGYDVNRMMKKQLRGAIDSWAIRFTYNCFLRGGLVSYPSRSLVSNTGANGSGTHKGNNREYIENDNLPVSLDGLLPFTSAPTLTKAAHQEFKSFTKKRFLWRRGKSAISRRLQRHFSPNQSRNIGD